MSVYYAGAGSRARFQVTVGASLAAAVVVGPSASATVTPISAHRSVNGVSTEFGRYNQSFTDHEAGGTPPQAQMYVTMTQDSTIGDGTTSPFVSYYGLGQESATAGGMTLQFAQGYNMFTLLFQVTSPETLVHTFTSTGTTLFTCTLTPSGGTAVNLLSPGANNIDLNPGMYTLDIHTSGLATNGTYSHTWTLTGTVSFVPAPSAAMPLLVLGTLFARRRRAC